MTWVVVMATVWKSTGGATSLGPKGLAYVIPGGSTVSVVATSVVSSGTADQGAGYRLRFVFSVRNFGQRS